MKITQRFLRTLSNTLALVAASCLGWSTVGSAQTPLERYPTSIYRNGWSVQQSPLRCRLALRLPSYGVAFFQQRNAEPMTFILHHWAGGQVRGPVEVMMQPPAWKPASGKRRLGQLEARVTRKYFRAEPRLARKILASLDAGFVTRIAYQSPYQSQLQVDLSPVNFQKPHARFVQCLDQLLPYTFRDVAFTTFYFATNGYRLAPAMRQRLAQVATYLLADKQVIRVAVRGYTDDVGRKGHNIYLSELRAKQVAEQLRKLGVANDLLTVEWFGMQDPEANNDSPVGRAVNRRVEIELIHELNIKKTN